MIKKLKFVAIHLIDMFDIYIIHNLAFYCEELDGKFGDWVFDTSGKICSKIAGSEWWGDDQCFCFYCKRNDYSDID